MWLKAIWLILPILMNELHNNDYWALLDVEGVTKENIEANLIIIENQVLVE